MVSVGTSLFSFYVLIIRSIPPFIAGSLFGLASALGIPLTLIGGYLGSRYPVVRIFSLFIVVGALGYVGLAFSDSILLVGLFYIIVRATEYVPQTLLPVLVSQNIQRERVGRFLGKINALGSGVGALGVLLAGVIAQSVGFEMLFLTVAGLFVVSIILLGLHVPRGIEHGMQSDRDENGEGTKLEWISRHKPLFMISIAVMVLAAGLYSDKFYPTFLSQKFFASTLSIAIFDTVMEVVYAATNPIGGLLADKIGPKTVTAMGYSIMGIALFLFPFMPSLISLYFIIALFSLGQSFGYFIILTAIRSVDEKNASTASGIVNTFTTIGVTISGPIGGYLWGYIGQVNSFLIALPVSLLSISILVFSHKRKKIKEDPREDGV
ncbi:MAG: MFS transporter [Thermoplasmataceae archaeon]